MKPFLLAIGLLIGAASNQCQAQVKKPINAKAPLITISDPGQNVGDQGKVSFIYQGQKVTYTTVRAKDGNVWLQQNLGSTQVATNANDKYAMGDLFQWGRWDDGHQVIEPANTRRAEATPNNPSGLSKTESNPFYYGIFHWWMGGSSKDKWEAATPASATSTNGCDPCKLIGQGWHLPNIDEMQKIVEMEHITDVNGAFLSMLKLIGAGNRDGTNGFIRPRAFSYTLYWTSTSNEGQALAMDLPSGGFVLSERGEGYSIRCLKSTK